MQEFDNVFWSDIAGYVGLGCWFVVMTPQIYTNWKLRNASSLSPGYVFLGLLGNVLSFVGGILAGLIFTSILVTGYLSVLGILMLFQIWWYQPQPDDMSQYIEWRVKEPSILSRKSFLPEYEPVLNLPKHMEERRISIANDNFTDLPSNAIPFHSNYGSLNEHSMLLSKSLETGPSLRQSFGPNYYDSIYSGSVRSNTILSQRDSIRSFNQRSFHRPNSLISDAPSVSNRMSVVSSLTYPATMPPPNPKSQVYVLSLGTIVVLCLVTLVLTVASPRQLLTHVFVPQTFGWMSSLLLISSRGFQIYKNLQRKSVEGLAPSMFTLGILGNINYLLAMLLFSTESSYLLYNLPWLVGAASGLLLDAVVVSQFIIFGNNTITYDVDDSLLDRQ